MAAYMYGLFKLTLVVIRAAIGNPLCEVVTVDLCQVTLNISSYAGICIGKCSGEREGEREREREKERERG